jgi:hypothetical protein
MDAPGEAGEEVEAVKRNRPIEAAGDEDNPKRARAEGEGEGGATSLPTAAAATPFSAASSRSVSPVGDDASRGSTSTEGDLPGKMGKKLGRKPPAKIMTALPVDEIGVGTGAGAGAGVPAPVAGDGPIAAIKTEPGDAPIFLTLPPPSSTSSSSSSGAAVAAAPAPAEGIPGGKKGPRVKLHRHMCAAVRGEDAGEEEGFESVRTGTVRRIMRVDNQLKPIQAEAVPLLGKACELFIGHLVGQAADRVLGEHRHNILYSDLQRLSALDSPLKFLEPLLPSLENLREEHIARTAIAAADARTAVADAADMMGRRDKAKLDRTVL